MKADSNITEAIDILASYAPSCHFLWDGSKLHCSPAKINFLRDVQKTGLDHLDENNWNTLMFSVVYTIGDSRSFDFLLPLYLEKIFNDEIEIVHFGWENLLSKFEYVSYNSWSKLRYDAANRLLASYKEKDELI